MTSLTPGTWDPYMPDTTEPQDWFFTFGSGHTWHGEPVGCFFVRINGTALAARQQMVAVFGDRWSHQYSSEDAAGVQRYCLTELKLPAPIALPGRVHYVVPLSADGETQGPLCEHDFRDEPGPPLFATDDHEVTCAACLGAGIRLGLIEPTPMEVDAGTQVPAAPGTDTTADLLAKARRFAREWRAQEGCGAQVLDDLADAILAFDGDTLPRPAGDTLLTIMAGLLQRWWLAEPPPIGSGALRDHTRIVLGRLQRDGRGQVSAAQAMTQATDMLLAHYLLAHPDVMPSSVHVLTLLRWAMDGGDAQG